MILNVADDCRLRDPPMVKASASVHKCVICGNTMSSDEYEANGCIFCGANAQPLVCSESYDVRDREKDGPWPLEIQTQKIGRRAKNKLSESI